MNVKLDESIPGSVTEVLTDAGHEVDTVLDECLGGVADPDVLAAATAAGLRCWRSTA